MDYIEEEKVKSVDLKAKSPSKSKKKSKEKPKEDNEFVELVEKLDPVMLDIFIKKYLKRCLLRHNDF